MLTIMFSQLNISITNINYITNGVDDVLLTPHKSKIGKLLATLVKHTNFLTIYSAKNIYIVQNQIFQ